MEQQENKYKTFTFQQYNELLETIENNVTGKYPGLLLIPLICSILDKKKKYKASRDKRAKDKAKNKAIKQYLRIIK